MSTQSSPQLTKNFSGTTIFIPKDCQLEELEKGLILFYTLKNFGENVNIWVEKIEPEKKESLLENPGEYILSINTTNKEITEMRYEKKEGKLEIYLTLKKGTLQEKDITLQSPNSDKKTSLLITPYSLSFPKVKLLARALNKINFEGEKNIYSLSFTLDDFHSTRTHPKDLGFILEELTSKTWQLPSLLLLWESHSSPLSIKGVFYSSNENWLKKILKEFKGQQKGKGILFSTPEKEFQPLKEKILNLL